MARHALGPVSDFPPGSRKIVKVDGREIGVFHTNGQYRAVRNACPHRGGPLCRGELSGTTFASAPGQIGWEKQGSILRCPWHGWEFDLETGRTVFDDEIMVAIYPIWEQDGQLVLSTDTQG